MSTPMSSDPASGPGWGPERARDEPAGHPALVARPRLTAALVDALRGRLTVVVAGAGYGKSTALGQALDAQPIPAIRLNLGPREADPGLFLHALLIGLSGRFPGFGAGLTDELARLRVDAAADGAARDGERICDLLAAEVRATLAEPVLVAWDDFHLVDETPALQAIVTRLLTDLPPTVRFAIASRRLPALPLARWRVQGRVAWFDEAALAFSPDELAALAGALGVGLGEREAHLLATRTEGWVAPACLLVPALQGLGPAAQRERIERLVGSGGVLYDFLTEEAFARQPPDVQDFLCASAVPERFSAALMDRVRGDEAGADAIDRIGRGHLFLVDLGDGWYRYHQLFRDFLLRKWAQRQSPAERGALQRRVGRALLAADQAQEAIPHLLAAGDIDAALPAVAAAAAPMLRSGASATLRRWIDGLPPERARNDPVVAWAAGLALVNLGQAEAAIPWFEAAAQAPEPLACTEREARAEAEFQLVSILGLLGRDEEAVARAEQIEGAGRATPRLYAVAGNAHLALDHWDLGGRLLARAVAESAAGPVADAAVIRSIYGCNYLAQVGRLDEAMEHATWALEMQRRHDPTVNLANGMSVVAMLQTMRGEYTEARATWDEIRATAAAGGYTGYVAPLADQADGMLSLALGDVERAAACAARCDEAAARPGAVERRPYVRYLLHAGLALARGEVANAAHHAELVLAMTRGKPATEWSAPDAALILARCGRPVAAQAGLAPYVELVAHNGQTYWEADGRLVLAWLLHLLDDDQAATQLERALALIAHQGHDYLLTRRRQAVFLDLLPAALARPSPPLELLTRAVEAGDAALGIVDEVAAGPAASPARAAARRLLADGGAAKRRADARPRLEITSLGGFGVRVDGQGVPDRAWGRPKARQLFKLLLCRPGLAISRDLLYETLWPELPPERAAGNVDYALHLLRRALRDRQSPDRTWQLVQADGNGCRLNLGADDAWDVATFRDAYRRAQAHGFRPVDPAGPTGAPLEPWSAAEAAYGGVFLPDDLYEDWTAELRETLRDAYLDVLWHVGQGLARREDWEESIARYRLMLQADPLQERAHRSLMEALASSGRRDLALRQYLLCRRLLRTELDAEPEAATMALYERLRRSVPAA